MQLLAFLSVLSSPFSFSYSDKQVSSLHSSPRCSGSAVYSPSLLHIPRQVPPELPESCFAPSLSFRRWPSHSQLRTCSCSIPLVSCAKLWSERRSLPSDHPCLRSSPFQVRPANCRGGHRLLNVDAAVRRRVKLDVQRVQHARSVRDLEPGRDAQGRLAIRYSVRRWRRNPSRRFVPILRQLRRGKHLRRHLQHRGRLPALVDLLGSDPV